MEYTEIINEADKRLAIVAPGLFGLDIPGNVVQIQIEQDDHRAYIDLWLKDAIALRDKLDEWIKIKHDQDGN